MHPTARIVLYLISALVVPGLNHLGLGCMLAACLALSYKRLKPVGRLLWRTRWLFLLLFLGDSYSLPGKPLLLEAGGWSPTWEGMGAGASHGLHLLVILLMLDGLVLAMPRSAQLAGLYGFLKPFSALGIEAGRATVRLGLTLEVMELPVERRGTLRELLTEYDVPHAGESMFQLSRTPWRGLDGMMLSVGVVLLALLWHYA